MRYSGIYRVQKIKGEQEEYCTALGSTTVREGVYREEQENQMDIGGKIIYYVKPSSFLDYKKRTNKENKNEKCLNERKLKYFSEV